VKYFLPPQMNDFSRSICTRDKYLSLTGVLLAVSWPWIYQDKGKGNIKSVGKVRPIRERRSKWKKGHKRSARSNGSRPRHASHMWPGVCILSYLYRFGEQEADGKTTVNISRQWTATERRANSANNLLTLLFLILSAHELSRSRRCRLLPRLSFGSCAK